MSQMPADRPDPDGPDRTGRPGRPTPRAGRRPVRRPLRLVAALALLLGLVAAACSSPSDKAAGPASLGPALSTPEGGTFPPGTTVRLLGHDSTNISESVLDQFTQSTGIKVEIVLGGDAVAMVNQAVLTAGNPQADVLYGIDDNLLGRAAQANLFEPYTPAGLSSVASQFTDGTDGNVTPIDYGDVCINYDRKWFADKGLAVPTTFEQLADPTYKDLLVVEDPTASSPGLAFMLATIAKFGGGDDSSADAPWLQYWEQLKANGAKVADSWETAYYTDFSGSSGKGPRPLVVSYASSPPAEVTDPSIPADQAPTGTMTSTCYRQIEYAGILRGASNPAAAKALIDFMLTVPFQEDVPGQMYVFPVNPDAKLPDTFAKYAEPVTSPLVLPAARIDANRDRWLQQWSSLFR